MTPGQGRKPARIQRWRLCMAASALNFGAGRTQLHQVLVRKGRRPRERRAAPTVCVTPRAYLMGRGVLRDSTPARRS